MQLLLDREQVGTAWFSLIPLRIGSGVTFMLHATLELDAEEEALLKRYNFTRSTLVVSDMEEDLKMSFRPALFLGIVAFVVLFFFFSFGTSLFLSFLVIVGMTAVYFKTLREQIVVSELMGTGRKFRCDSIVALVKKEHHLEGLCATLRQVMESAKHWGNREAVPLPPLEKEAAKELVAKL